MRGMKRIFAVVFCCAFVLSGPAKAMFPVFDIVEAPQSFSKIPVVFDQVKGLKDQLMAMQANLKAMGDKIKSIAMFTKDLADKIVDAYEEVAGYTEEINDRLNLNGDSTRETGRASRDVEKTTEDVVDSSINETENIVDEEDITKEEEEPSTSIFVPQTPGDHSVESMPVPTLPVVNTSVVVPVKPTVDPLKIVNPSVKQTSSSVGETVSIPQVKTKGVVKSKLVSPVKLEMTVEEEEEEEEVSIEEENAKIEEVKESIKNALQNCKEINIQFNDLLDLSINSIQQNSDVNSKTLEKIAEVINRAEKLNNSEKNIFIDEVKTIKEKELRLTDSLIGVVEGIKTSYNSAYKNKIEDGYKNYEKIAISYIKGDISKKEFKDAGKKLKNETRSIDIVPDKMVISEIDEKIKEIQNELKLLTNKIKQAEERNQKI